MSNPSLEDAKFEDPNATYIHLVKEAADKAIEAVNQAKERKAALNELVEIEDILKHINNILVSQINNNYNHNSPFTYSDNSFTTIKDLNDKTINFKDHADPALGNVYIKVAAVCGLLMIGAGIALTIMSSGGFAAPVLFGIGTTLSGTHPYGYMWSNIEKLGFFGTLSSLFSRPTSNAVSNAAGNVVTAVNELAQAVKTGPQPQNKAAPSVSPRH